MKIMHGTRPPASTSDLANVGIISASVTFVEQTLASPLMLSSGSIHHLTEAQASVRVRAGDREAAGAGSIYLSDLWAWPEPSLSHAQRDRRLRDLCREIARNLANLCGNEAAHPLELGLRLHDTLARQSLQPPAPAKLAIAMCLSPFDAALHDATGTALGLPAFAFYDDPFDIPSADRMFGRAGVCRAIQRMLRKRPRRTSPAWLVVGKADVLQKDVRRRVAQHGYRCFKLKLGGRDNREDVERTIEVYRAARGWNVDRPAIIGDSNEANPDAHSVREYLTQLRQTDTGAFDALQYLEQPTARDILACPQNWKAVTKIKPVLVDEGLTDLQLLPEARRQGWSGIALKTCKGHSFALVAAAWAHAYRMVLSLQDLTNPGVSLIHGALFGAHLPTINGAELNSPQFTPAANRSWARQYPGLFIPCKGIHQIPQDILGLHPVRTASLKRKSFPDSTQPPDEERVA